MCSGAGLCTGCVHGRDRPPQQPHQAADNGMSTEQRPQLSNMLFPTTCSTFKDHKMSLISSSCALSSFSTYGTGRLKSCTF